MPPSEQRRFVSSYAVGVALSVLAYAALLGLRSFRDFYSRQIFGAALGVASPPAAVVIVADLPGAALVCAGLVGLSYVADSRRALLLMLGAAALALALTLALTVAFRARAIGGLAWILSYSTTFYLGYSVLATPLYERLFAATRTEGTCVFLIFLSDFAGYVVTIAMLLYQSFGPGLAPPAGAAGADAELLRLFVAMAIAAAALVCAALVAAAAYFRWRLDPAAAVCAEAADRLDSRTALLRDAARGGDLRGDSQSGSDSASPASERPG